MTKVANKARNTVRGLLVLSGVALLATTAVMVFVPTERIWLEIGALAAGLGAGAWLARFGVSGRWTGSAVVVLFIAVWFALGTAGYAWFGGFLAGTGIGAASAIANCTPPRH